ncbi:MAG: prohibitin family protein [Thermoplasmata archaeon]|nr:MAG: prohibitin family protein [Thermoplasmata archaeon]
MNKDIMYIIIGVSIAGCVLLTIASVTTVDAGHVGIHNLFGVVDDTELQPGLHFKNPFASVTKMSIKTQEYTMSNAQGEGAVYGSDVIPALTKEGLSVDLDMTVLYKLNPTEATRIYKEIGVDYIDVIVRPQIRTIIREVVANFEAKQLYSEDRQRVALEITEKLDPELTKRGIILERVLIRNIALPTQLVLSIEEKLVAEQAAERMTFVLRQEQKEAERKVIEAEGIRNSTMIVQEGLARSPEYLTYLWLQKLENHDSVVYVMEGNMGLPIFKNIDS